MNIVLVEAKIQILIQIQILNYIRMVKLGMRLV